MWNRVPQTPSPWTPIFEIMSMRFLMEHILFSFPLTILYYLLQAFPLSIIKYIIDEKLKMSITYKTDEKKNIQHPFFINKDISHPKLPRKKNHMFISSKRKFSFFSPPVW